MLYSRKGKLQGMNRTILIEKINYCLSILNTSVKLNNPNSLMNDTVNCENIFKEVFNCLWDLDLENTNLFKSNFSAIDLKDDTNKIIFQITSERSTNKIQTTLDKPILKSYKGYKLCFLIISDQSVEYFRDQNYTDKYLNTFDRRNILSLKDIVSFISKSDVSKLELIKEKLEKNIIIPPRDVKMLDTNLAEIIKMLGDEEIEPETNNLNNFQIVKKIEFNNLKEKEEEILELTSYYSKLNEKYKTLNLLGKNKERSVLLKLSKIYNDIVFKNVHLSEKDIYEKIIEEVIIYVKDSPNFNKICEEELLFAVEIIVCDAFIKCKIFKNPKGYYYVN